MFIKKRISVKLSTKDRYYDIVTPYGYGGPTICNAINRTQLVAEFNVEFSRYCKKNNIISEFIRFSPVLNNHVDFEAILDVSFNRNTVVTYLDIEDPFMTQLSPTCRNKIRKSIKNGVVTEIDHVGESMDNFVELYKSTMIKNNASNYYYFSKLYFDQFRTELENKFIIINSIHEGKIIASAIFLISDTTMHYHLAATNPEYYKLAPNNLFLWRAIQWGIENNMSQIHLGGGLTNLEDDNLFKFKSGFSTSPPLSFYVGKKIHNLEIYKELVKAHLDNSTDIKNENYFPAYRG